MATSKPKLIAAVVALILLGFIGGILWNVLSGPGHSTRQVHVDPAAVTPRDANIFNTNQPPAIPAKPDSEWLPKFNSVYALAKGETVKFVSQPFIPERLEFYRARMGAPQTQAIPRGGDFYVVTDEGQGFRMQTAWFTQPNLADMIRVALGLHDWEFIAPESLRRVQLKGDIVIRNGSTVDQNADPLAAAISQRFGRTLTLRPKQMQVISFIMGGHATYRGPATTRATSTGPGPASITKNPTAPYIHIGLTGSDSKDYVYVDHPISFLRMLLEQVTQRPVALDGLRESDRISCQLDRSAYQVRGVDGPKMELLDQLLASIEEQSELTFKKQTAMTTVWVLSEGAPAPTQPASSPATTAPLR